MIKQILMLLDLQDLDIRIIELKKEQKELPENLQSLKKDVELKKNELAKAEQTAKDVKVQQKNLETEAESQKSVVIKHKQQLLQIKNNEQYRALTKEIENDESKVSQIEEKILERMMQYEEAEQGIKDAKAALANSEQRLLQGEEQIKRQIAEVDDEIEELSDERAQLKDKITPNAVSVYERIMHHKGTELAIVPISGNVCQGCYMKLTPNDVNEIHKAHSLQMCDNCSRILYSPPESE